jgi:hypothetical protein
MDEFNLSNFIKDHSGEIVILALVLLVLVTLLISLPQLLRANLRKAEMWHEQRMQSLEKGLPLPPEDDRARMGGRTAVLVPIFTIVSTATVTSFLVVYKSEMLFPVALSIWIVAGVVSLAAITGGVALIGRLAALQTEEPEEQDEPTEHSYRD